MHTKEEKKNTVVRWWSRSSSSLLDSESDLTTSAKSGPSPADPVDRLSARARWREKDIGVDFDAVRCSRLLCSRVSCVSVRSSSRRVRAHFALFTFESRVERAQVLKRERLSRGTAGPKRRSACDPYNTHVHLMLVDVLYNLTCNM